MLGARPGDTNNIGFLKGIVSDERGGYLPSEDDNGDGVHIGG